MDSQRNDETPVTPEPAPTHEKEPYEPPRVESVKLSREAAEALT